MSQAGRRKNHRRGIIAEYMALVWLVLKGYRFVLWRYKTPVGEIDLIVRRGKHLVFVEVKARSNYALAVESITRNNQERVVRAAQMFRIKHPRYAHYQVRFDAVLVTWHRWPYHLANVFGEITR